MTANTPRRRRTAAGSSIRATMAAMTGRRCGRCRARHPDRQLQRHAQLQPPDPARGSRRARGIKPINEGGQGGWRRKPRPQAGSPYAIEVNAGMAHADRPVVQGAALRRNPRHRSCHRRNALGSAARHRAQERPVRGIPSMLPFKIGTPPNNGGPLVTAGGLIFIAARNR